MIKKSSTNTYVNLKKQITEGYCINCKKTKPISDFYLRKNGKPLSYCIKCQDISKNLKFEEKLELIVQIFGGACKDCGAELPMQVYSFYSDNAVFSIGRLRNMSLKRALKELDGYIMVCKNCCALRKWSYS